MDHGLQKIEFFRKEPKRGMHSEAHALAKEVSEYCGEPKKFGMYLGVIKNIGLLKAYKIFSEIKQGKDIETPGKLFVYLSSYNKKQDKKIKRSRKPPTNFAGRGKRSAAPKRVGPIRPSRSARI